MLRSLRTRILLMTAAIVAVAIGAVGLFSRQITLSQFESFVAAGNASQGERLRAVLTAWWRENGRWDGVSATLERLAETSGRPLVLASTGGDVIAVAPAELAGGRVRIAPNGTITLRTRVEGPPVEEREMVFQGPHLALTGQDGTAIGSLFVLPAEGPGGRQAANSSMETMSRSLLLATLAAGVVALLAAAALSRRILGPVEALTAAARRLGKGEPGRPIEPASSDEIGDLTRAFNAMAASVARAEDLRRGMVADVAHELRTPLTNIRCQLEAIQDGLVRPEREVIDSLHEEAMLLKRLIDDLHELALAEAGELRLEMKPVSIAGEIGKAMASFEPRARAGGVTLAFDEAFDLPEVRADAERLGQILRNLIGNAVAHTPPGGRIEVAARRDGAGVEVLVRDSGAGIEASHLPFVFERFYRADGSRSRSTGGAGLGLAIVRQLVMAHGGSVRAESPPGQGACFRVFLPAAPSPSS